MRGLSVPTAGPVSQIKRIQRGTISLVGASTTATITSVDTAKSVVSFLGQSNTGSTADHPNGYFMRLTLTNATTVTADRGGTGAITPVVSFQVVEYY